MTWFWILTSWAAPCTQAGIDELVDALAKVDREHHVPLASHGLALACSGPVSTALGRIQEVAPDQRLMLDAQLLTEAPLLFNAQCAGGLKVAMRSVEVAASEKRGLVYDGCEIDDALITRSAFVAGDGLLFTPLVAAELMKQSGATSPQIRTVVAALAGAGPTASKRPDEVFMDPYIELAIPMLEPAEYDDDTTGIVDGGMGIGGGGIGSMFDLPAVESSGGKQGRADAEAGFEERVEPSWSRKARKAGGRCVATVEVSRSGEYLGVAWRKCPDVLRKDVEKALEASTYWAASTGKGSRHFVARFRQ